MVCKRCQVWDDKGMGSFNDLCSVYNVPRISFFFYLWLRLAMRTCGVPWDVPLTHSLHSLLDVGGRNRGLVSRIYLLLNSVCKPLAVHQIWSRALGCSVDDFACQQSGTIWMTRPKISIINWFASNFYIGCISLPESSIWWSSYPPLTASSTLMGTQDRFCTCIGIAQG